MDILMDYIMNVCGIALATIIIFVVKKYLIPWFKVTIGNKEYEKLCVLIKDLMAVAEEQFGPQTGAEKKEFVIKELKKLDIDFNERFVRSLIDGFTSVLTAEGILNAKK